MAAVGSSASARRRLERCRRVADSLGPHIQVGVGRALLMPTPESLPTFDVEQVRSAWERMLASPAAAAAEPPLLSLYVHIPFCPKVCEYCVFHRHELSDPAALSAYLRRLHDEIDFFAPTFRGVPFVTNYLGGGTPTLLDEVQLAQLLEHLDTAFERRRGGEWTFETTPYSLTEAKARLFREHGFNRVSVGVQSFHSATLAAVGRTLQHRQHVADAIALLKAHRFHINLDLIHGLPNETVADTLEAVRAAMELGVTKIHVAVLLPNTPPLPGSRDETPPDVLAQRLAQIGEPEGYRVRNATTSISLGREEEANLLTEEGAEAGGQLVRYSDLTVDRPMYILGFGPSARCYVEGHLRYEYTHYPPTAPFDPQQRIVRGVPLTPLLARQLYVTRTLTERRRLDPAAYQRRFGEDLRDAFGVQLDQLLTLDRLRSESGSFVHSDDEALERFVTELFFVDDDRIESAASSIAGRGVQSASGPALAASVRVGFRGDTVTFGLLRVAPRRRFAHQRGPYAFFVEMAGRAPDACDLSAAQRLIEAVFIRVFDGAVDDDAPSSVAELVGAIGERATRLQARGFRFELTFG